MNDTEIVITGVNGFVGEHLAREIKQQGYKVHGIGREAAVNDKVMTLVDTYTQCNLVEEGSFKDIPLQNVTAIIHLAGLAAVGESFQKPLEYLTQNGIMTHNVLSSALDQGFTGRTVVISSGALYDAQQPMPLTESSQLAENSPYAVGKILEENVGLYYKNRGLDVVIARPFNHIGPGQGQGFLLPDLYSQVVLAQENNSQTISVGNLTSRRDYTDVRDIVKAYVLLASAKSLQHDVYNIASGVSRAGDEILETLLHAMQAAHFEVTIDPSKVRPTDAQEIIGDASRVKLELGWQPAITLESTIHDFIQKA